MGENDVNSILNDCYNTMGRWISYSTGDLLKSTDKYFYFVGGSVCRVVLSNGDEAKIEPFFELTVTPDRLLIDGGYKIKNCRNNERKWFMDGTSFYDDGLTIERIIDTVETSIEVIRRY